MTEIFNMSNEWVDIFNMIMEERSMSRSRIPC